MSKTYTSPLRSLARWYERQKRALPWRETPSVYRVWVSEIMLQQTQVVTVIPYFERFIARFPSVEILAAAREEDVLLLWSGLGYYSRAKNLWRAARGFVSEGGFPQTRDEWLKAPGVGEYTAGAILSIALNHPEPILDGNVERFLSRVRRISRERGESAYKARLWRLSRVVVETAHRHGVRPGITNQALMELGATVCTPRQPRCLICPVRSVCKGFAVGDAETFPQKKKPKDWVDVRERVHCILDRTGRVLLRKRSGLEWRAGLWDLVESVPHSPSLIQLGKVKTRYVVTRHRVERETIVWRAGRALRASESDAAETRWANPDGVELATGSAFKKTWKQIRETFPEALRQS